MPSSTPSSPITRGSQSKYLRHRDLRLNRVAGTTVAMTAALMSSRAMPSNCISWPNHTQSSSAVRLVSVEPRHSPRTPPSASKTAKTVLVLPESMARIMGSEPSAYTITRRRRRRPR